MLESSSVSYGKASAYLPVIDLCKSYFRIEARDDARGIREKVTGKLLTLDEALRAMVPGFLSLLDVPIDDAAWDGARPRAAPPAHRRRPAADAAPGEPGPAAVPGVRGSPLGRCRDPGAPRRAGREPADGAGPPAGQLPAGVQPRLGEQDLLQPAPARPPACRRARRSCCGRCSASDEELDPLKRLLVERTEGVPFFLEESVRTLVETGALAGERGALSTGAALRHHPGAGHGAGHPGGPDRSPASGGQDPAPDGGRHRQGRPVRAPAGHRRAPGGRRSGMASGVSRPPSSCTRPRSSPSWSTPSSTR